MDVFKEISYMSASCSRIVPIEYAYISCFRIVLDQHSVIGLQIQERANFDYAHLTPVSTLWF